ncbi:hypothetical protein QF028_002289 [Neobacillus sp. B4I6]
MDKIKGREFDFSESVVLATPVVVSSVLVPSVVAVSS